MKPDDWEAARLRVTGELRKDLLVRKEILVEISRINSSKTVAVSKCSQKPDSSLHRLLSLDPDTFESELAELLDDVETFVRRYVVFSDDQAAVVALWVAHTHALDAADTTPYLSITSAAMQSGKTRLLEVLNSLVPRSWLTGRITAAVLVRKIDAQGSTLLLDESDAAFKHQGEYAETLRSLLNTGFQRSGIASLCVGQGANLTYKDFHTFSPKAIAGIGSRSLPDTVRDRAIPITLKRKTKTETVERFRQRNAQQQSRPLVQALAAWSREAIPALRDARPAVPNSLSDRAADV